MAYIGISRIPSSSASPVANKHPSNYLPFSPLNCLLMSSPKFSQPASFVRLTPANTNARRAFNEVSILMKDPNMIPDLKHASQFMVIEPWRQLPSSREQSLALSDLETGTETDGTGTEKRVEPLQYQGYYDLSFRKRPFLLQLGWVVGRGRWDINNRTLLNNGKVDLMLAPFADPASKYNVLGKHAALFFNSNGCLGVKVASSRMPEILLGDEKIASGSRIITSKTQLISFGNLSYQLAFVTEDEPLYQRNLSIFFTSYLKRDVPAPDISATPSPWDIVIQDWACKRTVGAGGHGTVRAATNRRTGEAAAAKIVVRDGKKWPVIAQEIIMLDCFPDHV